MYKSRSEHGQRITYSSTGDWLIDSLIHWLIDWLIDWVIDWLSDWVVDHKNAPYTVPLLEDIASPGVVPVQENKIATDS